MGKGAADRTLKYLERRQHRERENVVGQPSAEDRLYQTPAAPGASLDAGIDREDAPTDFGGDHDEV